MIPNQNTVQRTICTMQRNTWYDTGQVCLHVSSTPGPPSAEKLRRLTSIGTRRVYILQSALDAVPHPFKPGASVLRRHRALRTGCLRCSSTSTTPRSRPEHTIKYILPIAQGPRNLDQGVSHKRANCQGRGRGRPLAQEVDVMIRRSSSHNSRRAPKTANLPGTTLESSGPGRPKIALPHNLPERAPDWDVDKRQRKRCELEARGRGPMGAELDTRGCIRIWKRIPPGGLVPSQTRHSLASCPSPHVLLIDS
ncbi:hypothetical protein C8Q74DRAFT_858769 [Fomes fomentarius]|nr:hypothetical protein C8Q74DRAFT_858769 [Fomes fomentarius]